MQASIENTINIAAAFSCKLCKKVALQPLQNECCTIIICDTCIAPSCYHCKKACAYRKSPFLEHLYKCITIKCPFKCMAVLNLFQLKSHLVNCPEATMQCAFCKEKSIKTALYPQHMGSMHPEECSRLLIEFHKDKTQPKCQNKIKVEPKISPFRIGVSGTPRICRNGRLVCGGEMGIVTRPQGLFGSLNKLICSNDNGSCNKCMKLDKERLGLPQNVILNMLGRICYYSTQKKRLACGLTFAGKNNLQLVCNAGTPQHTCIACHQSLDLINRGLYRELLTL